MKETQRKLLRKKWYNIVLEKHESTKMKQWFKDNNIIFETYSLHGYYIGFDIMASDDEVYAISKAIKTLLN